MEPINFWFDKEPIPPMSTFSARIAARMNPFQIVIPDFILLIEPIGLDFYDDQRKPLAADCIINSSLHD